MYRARFISRADSFGEWLPLGGLSAHLDKISVLLHLAATENIAAAMAYGAPPVCPYVGIRARARNGPLAPSTLVAFLRRSAIGLMPKPLRNALMPSSRM